VNSSHLSQIFWMVLLGHFQSKRRIGWIWWLKKTGRFTL